jgi:opacity protein-like surface antigen
MASFRAVIIAGAVAIGAFNVAHAADLDLPPPPPVEAPLPPVVSGWYLRGDVGVGIDQLNQFYSTDAPVIGGFSYDGAALGQQAIIDGGVGYKFNNWIRFDVTGEYRTDTKYWALENYTAACTGGGPICYDGYTGRVSTWDTMANGYIDLGTWWNITPFVGGGVGVAFNHFGSVYDNNFSTGGSGTAPANWSTNLAWNVQAGIDYAFTPNWMLEFSYRFFDGGIAKTGAFNCGGACTNEVQSFNIYSQDIRIGLRYMFADIPAVAPPLVTKY